MGNICCANKESFHEEVSFDNKKLMRFDSSGSIIDMERSAKVDKIWEEFDVDRDGKLKRDEAYNFLRSSLKEMSGREPSE